MNHLEKYTTTFSGMHCELLKHPDVYINGTKILNKITNLPQDISYTL